MSEPETADRGPVRDASSEAQRRRALRSVQARKKRLLLEDVEAGLGPLQTEEDAKRRLDRLTVWITAGLVSGSQGSAAVRAVETWLKAHSEELDRERLRAAEKRVKELERELAAVRGRGLGVA